MEKFLVMMNNLWNVKHGFVKKYSKVVIFIILLPSSSESQGLSQLQTAQIPETNSQNLHYDINDEFMWLYDFVKID